MAAGGTRTRSATLSTEGSKDNSPAGSTESLLLTLTNGKRGRPKMMSEDQLIQIVDKVSANKNQELKDFFHSEFMSLSNKIEQKINNIEKKIEETKNKTDAAVVGISVRVTANGEIIEETRGQLDRMSLRVIEIEEKTNTVTPGISLTDNSIFDKESISSNILVESANREARKNNVIMRGLQKVDDDDTSKGMTADLDFVKKTINYVNDIIINENNLNKNKLNYSDRSWSIIGQDVNIEVKRLGHKNSGSMANHPRPLKVKFNNNQYSLLFMQAFNHFKKKEKVNFYFKHISISMDLTPQQQKQRVAVWKQLQEKIALGHTDLVMRQDFGEFHIVKKKNQRVTTQM